MPLLFEDKNNPNIQIHLEWSKLRQYVQDTLGHKPDIQTCLFLIGMNRLGEVREFEKEEKVDLIHVGLCEVLLDEYYAFSHEDSELWPHYKAIKPLPALFIKEQETYLKERIIDYFQRNIY
ncbi:MAG: hypothetical protein MUE53_06095 [Chitinophagales bacterium]|nr:hypothetical protein [Chitinophagales bacterium]